MFITILILFIVSLAISAVGWIRFIWFFSVGYGYSISALAVTLAIMYGASLTWVTGLLLLLLFAYGIRLSTYLLVRELKNRNYVRTVDVMFSGTRRIELRQNINYGSDPEFQAYIKKTPILLPFIPIYSVSKYKWLKG